MERLHCPTCGNEVFFDSLECVRCHTQLAMALQPDGVLIELGDAAGGRGLPHARHVALQLAAGRSR